MVEYELSTIVQMGSQIATALGVCIAATYYILTLRNTEKIRKRDMVFQKLNPNVLQHYDILYDVVRMVDWDTLEEFYEKYFYWSNPVAFKKIMYVMNHYNSLGILLKDGIVDADQIFQLNSAGMFLNIYEKFKPWLDIQGVLPEGSVAVSFFGGIRYLYVEAKRLYPDAGVGGLTRSLEESIESAKRREAILKSTNT